jgi:hypothetical protein
MENPMELFFEIFTQTQKNSLEAAASFTDTCLVVVERMTQLNIELTRTAIEQSSEMGQLCLERTLSKVQR